MRFSTYQVAYRSPVDAVPVISIVFLLTFFFLLSWSFVLQPGVEVKLPMTAFPVASQQGKHVITLKEKISGNKNEVLYFFNEVNVTEELLQEKLKASAKIDFGEWITVNADEAISHGQVQKITSEIMKHGFRVTLATQRTAELSEK